MIASKISNNCARSAGDPGEEIFQGADPAFCGRSRQTIVSYDEKPGIQAIGTTAPDPAPEPGLHATFARDHEYKRNGTVSLLAGIDLLTAKVHALVRDRHRSREFIEFLKLLDAAYPAHTAIKLILDNHTAHIPKQTKSLARRSARRPLRIHLHSQAQLVAQSRRGLLFQARAIRPAPHPCDTPNRNSRIASWLQWTTSIRTPSFTRGLTNSIKPPDMIRTLETLY
jgi:hypothetical protein